MLKFVSGALTPSRLLVCALVNQFATPGLGSWLARRRIAGAGQMVLAFAGFALIVIWMMESFYSMFGQTLSDAAIASPPDWMWKWGWILFGASWVWALLTSVGLLFQARALEKAGKVPPRISEPPAAPGA